jgi:DNA polymerase-3 subunit delta'
MPFRDVFGHRRLLGVLARSVHRGSLPPSLILAGPSGVGKRRVAVALAQALNCTDLQVFAEPASHPAPGVPSSDHSTASPFPTTGVTAPLIPKLAVPALASDGGRATPMFPAADVTAPTNFGVGVPAPISQDACGRCPACLRIARGVHPDVSIIEPGDTGVIKVDQIRDVVDRAAYRPFEGRRRVVIFDEADALMPAAQNALLKTLEEPPASAVFLLITSRADALLATVRSRCPLLRFGALATDDVVAGLVAHGRTAAEARAVAATAEGSIGQALEASTGALVDARDVATRVLAWAASGDDPKRRLEGVKDLLTGTGAGGASDREQLAVHLRAMSSLLRDVELLATGSDARGLANPDARSDLDELMAFGGDRGLQAFAVIDRALAALDRNASSKIVADWLVLQL